MNNNYERMQEFLDMLKELALSNPEKTIDNSFVYSFLVRYGLELNSFSYERRVQQNYFEGWKERYKNNKNLFVNDQLQGNFCWFLTGYDAENAIKLYIPIDFEHIKEGTNQLFDFISQNNMIHQSKIASRIRNDNVVVRVSSLEEVKKIVDFVSNNKYIQHGMLKVNPFLPNINGIGMTMDNNYSFNSELSKLISSFIEWLKKENRLDLVTVEEFNNYIKFQIDYINDLDLKDIYVLLSKTTSKDFKFEDFIEYAKNKLVNDYYDGDRIVDPSYYLQKAIVVTANDYPYNSKIAILEYMKGNSSYFTRKQNARGGLKKYVKPEDVISLMTKKLHENGITYAANQDDLIDKYLDIVLNRQKAQNNTVNLQNKYEEEFEIIRIAFINTKNKYDKIVPGQAMGALRKLYLNNNPESFTNDFGDRTKLKTLVKTCDIRKVILNNIDINGLEINNVEDILCRFMNSLEKKTNNKMI